MDEVLFKALISYFNAEKIEISQDELRLQLFSHPHTPSLYAVAETLTFLKIENVAAQVEHGQLEFLPSNFIAFLRDENENGYFAHVHQSGNRVHLADHKDSISKEDFCKRWDGILLIAEQEDSTKVQRTFWQKGLVMLLVMICTLLVWPGIQALFFCLIGILGLMLSEEIFKTSNNMGSILGAKVCGDEKQNGCHEILGSVKYNISLFSLNDILFSFFATTLVFTLFYPSFNFMHVAVYAMAIAAVMTTVFIQKFIAKSWCRLCLLSSLLVVLQALIVLVGTSSQETILVLEPLWESLREVSVFGLLYVIALFIIFHSRKLRKMNHGLALDQIDLLRFKRSSKIISLLLSNGDRITSSEGDNPLESSNRDAEHIVRLVLSTSCKYCKDAFAMFYAYYRENKGKYGFQIIFNHYEVTNSKRNAVAANLIQICRAEGFETLLQKTDDWFSRPKDSAYLEKYHGHLKDENYTVLWAQRDWCKDNALFHTPIWLIDDYVIPEFYDASFINDFMKTVEENDIEAVSA
ncbi:hypothetical protein FGF1_39740 [Flavobacteriaceae bacterium GF1]